MSTGSPAQVTRRGFVPRLRDTGIRAKLALILLVPLAGMIILAATRLVDVSQRAREAGKVESLTDLGTHVTALDQLLQVERMSAAGYLANTTATADTYNATVRASDAEIRTFRAERRRLDDLPAAVRDRLLEIEDGLNTLDATRTQAVRRDGIGVAEVMSRYDVVLTDLLYYGDAVSQFAGDNAVGNHLRATSAFSRAKAGAAELQAIAYAAPTPRDLDIEQRTAVIAARTSQQEGLLTFAAFASPSQQSVVGSVVTGDAVTLADQISSRLGRGVAIPSADATRAFGAVVDLMRRAEQRLENENLELAGDHRDSVVRKAAVEASTVLLVLLVTIGLTVLVARSLSLSLRRLREGALTVANRDLPDAVARLRDSRNVSEGGADDIVRQVRDPIQVAGRDEIGQVAQAFNVVHREAIRIAAERAALRTNVSAMVLNLARRGQSLVDRMIAELDSIERAEEDPKRLARLLELDHLATRMRRNDENLLVLAGADSTAPRRQDALLVDALRAAQSEVELHNRIEFGTVDTDISIAAPAVNDVVRLIAELLDNATRFSPPTTVVIADARRIRDYVVVQVEDRGLGLSEEQLNQLNRRLEEPPTVDVAALRLMGLAVVGRLAARYGIRVELRANLGGGTVAQVILPHGIVVLPRRGPYEAPAGVLELGAAPGTDPIPTPDRLPLPGRVSAPLTAQSAQSALTGDPMVIPAPTSAPLALTDTGSWVAVLAAMPPVPAPPDLTPVEERAEAPIFVQMQQSWFRHHDEPRTEAWGMPTAGYAPPPHSDPATTIAPKPPVVVSPVVVSSVDVPSVDVPSVDVPSVDVPSVDVPSVVVSSVDVARVDASPVVVSPVNASPVDASSAAAPQSAPPADPESSAPAALAAAADRRNGSVPQPRAAAEDRWRTVADEGWQRAMEAAEPVGAGITPSGLPKRIPQAQLVPGGVHGGQRTENRRNPDEVRGLLSAYHRGVQRGRTDGNADAPAVFQAKEREL